MSKRSFRWSFM